MEVQPMGSAGTRHSPSMHLGSGAPGQWRHEAQPIGAPSRARWGCTA
eukprot:CAMPEP_0180026746 /NCGR_PEP_ID=MMETSP0984-20121128/25355_1 /TAXON_ID=483367 /ORGANISM="non described non described, Strain CCMP 2436" /LENGTH=46 /DNA_ID= /DNA_START= /DNA_END= /DNA_ORIENTATION=